MTCLLAACAPESSGTVDAAAPQFEAGEASASADAADADAAQGSGSFCEAGIGAGSSACLDWDEQSLTAAYAFGVAAAPLATPFEARGVAALDTSHAFSRPGSFAATTPDSLLARAGAGFVGVALAGELASARFHARLHLAVLPSGGAGRADLIVIHLPYGVADETHAALSVDGAGHATLWTAGSAVARKDVSVGFAGGGAWHEVVLSLDIGSPFGSVATVTIDGDSTQVVADATSARTARGAAFDFGIDAYDVTTTSVNFDDVTLDRTP